MVRVRKRWKPRRFQNGPIFVGTWRRVPQQVVSQSQVYFRNERDPEGKALQQIPWGVQTARSRGHSYIREDKRARLEAPSAFHTIPSARSERVLHILVHLHTMKPHLKISLAAKFHGDALVLTHSKSFLKSPHDSHEGAPYMIRYRSLPGTVFLFFSFF